jgi:outer membrane lipopolysaccharide assembly protein LptE/RlpB
MKIWSLFLVAVLFTGCKSVSISLKDKGSTPEEWKSFSIKTLESSAANCPLSYSAILTEDLKDALQNNTRLSLNTTTGSGEIYIEGKINSYQVTPISIQNNNNAAQNRLTIGVQFTIFIRSPKEETLSLSATRFADFGASTNLASIEGQLLEEINTQLTQDVINKLLGNW